jgi:hypothetical protein
MVPQARHQNEDQQAYKGRRTPNCQQRVSKEENAHIDVILDWIRTQYERQKEDSTN